MKKSALFAVFLAASVAAQNTAPKVPSFPVSADAVRMAVTLSDNRPLPKEAFTVMEDGRKQNLTLFSREPLPLDVVLLLDISGSVNETQAEQMNRLGKRFVQSLGRGDRMQIMHFGVNASTTQEFTGEKSLLEAALTEMPRHDATALRQSMYVALAQLEQVVTPPDCPRRRVLVVLTDAVDTRSHMDGELLRSRAHQANAAVFIIAVTPSTLQWTAQQDREFAESRYLLANICKETGGVYFECIAFIDALIVSKRIIRDLAAQYTLGWQSDSPTPDGFRRVQVLISGLSSDKYRHPTGYLATRRP
jgi:VWFA-related protein